MQPTRVDASLVWSPAIVANIASELGTNGGALLRFVNKATAQQFQKEIDLSQPVASWAFAERWSQPGACRQLTRQQRKQLTSCDAALSDLANLRVALTAAEAKLEDCSRLHAAAAGGYLETCRWLVDPSFTKEFSAERKPLSVSWPSLLNCAARSGQRAVCEWCLEQCKDVPDWNSRSMFPWVATNMERGIKAKYIRSSYALGSAACSAARGGHEGLTEWLLQQAAELAAAEAGTRGEACGKEVIEQDLGPAALKGCDLAFVAKLTAPCGPGQPPYLPAHWPNKGGWPLLAAALFSRGLDWRSKVEWLLARGTQVLYTDRYIQCRLYQTGVEEPLLEALPERFDWLRNQGCSPVGSNALKTALRKGSAQAVGWLLANGAVSNAHDAMMFLEAIWHAAVSGHLPALQALREGMELGPAHWNPLLHGAAKGGQLRVLTWAAECLPPDALATQLNAKTFRLAALAGDPAVLRWMREHGAAWEPRAWLTGVGSGTEAVVEVLGELGCPQPAPDLIYGVALEKGQWRQLPVLRRAGVTLGPQPAAILALAALNRAPKHVRIWILDEAGIEPQAEAAAVQAAEAAATALCERVEQVLRELGNESETWMEGNIYDWEREGESDGEGAGDEEGDWRLGDWPGDGEWDGGSD
ncbi:hypothetical protein HYH03_011419 [Edaphochlamys debaryana]|uniref:Uncharacterized protein n=1 Tax=Edaphochlamys debaryana TaxID=47281 RepID=A0A835XTS6_9CHLO|nr:hypothetical protein HYH03_011419 [Edaphochlamys debaryana]|eukprot:KAG2490113.1 hypothetical protein HYH03_011419 [Edaphochlamys debaryana]